MNLETIFNDELLPSSALKMVIPAISSDKSLKLRIEKNGIVAEYVKNFPLYAKEFRVQLSYDISSQTLTIEDGKFVLTTVNQNRWGSYGKAQENVLPAVVYLNEVKLKDDPRSVVISHGI